MTDLELNEVVSDTQLNELVARKLGQHECSFNKPLSYHYPITECDGWHQSPPPYSTSIAAAWEIVEFVSYKPYEKWFKLEKYDEYVAGWYMSMGAYQESQSAIAEGRADTAPRAICEAFLKLK